eukprot:TRINITY_DN54120_c0_g1_i1.p1 TRINITY_DN54120_c0_g1~~TRINITY_DN54120_c0_g1_i1.p1  ORF type:complete len:328 (-),score=22.22 TRINITY_DN54120_c0_g1_i1:446-1429(-)
MCDLATAALFDPVGSLIDDQSFELGVRNTFVCISERETQRKRCISAPPALAQREHAAPSARDIDCDRSMSIDKVCSELGGHYLTCDIPDDGESCTLNSWYPVFENVHVSVQNCSDISYGDALRGTYSDFDLGYIAKHRDACDPDFSAPSDSTVASCPDTHERQVLACGSVRMRVANKDAHYDNVPPLTTVRSHAAQCLQRQEEASGVYAGADVALGDGLHDGAVSTYSGVHRNSMKVKRTFTRMFIGNMPHFMNGMRMQEELCKTGFFGTYTSVNFPVNRDGSGRGFGFVTFSCTKEARRFASTFNGYEIDGHCCYVNPAARQHEDL